MPAEIERQTGAAERRDALVAVECQRQAAICFADQHGIGTDRGAACTRFDSKSARPAHKPRCRGWCRPRAGAAPDQFDHPAHARTFLGAVAKIPQLRCPARSGSSRLKPQRGEQTGSFGAVHRHEADKGGLRVEAAERGRFPDLRQGPADPIDLTDILLVNLLEIGLRRAGQGHFLLAQLVAIDLDPDIERLEHGCQFDIEKIAATGQHRSGALAAAERARSGDPVLAQAVAHGPFAICQRTLRGRGSGRLAGDLLFFGRAGVAHPCGLIVQMLRKIACLAA